MIMRYVRGCLKSREREGPGTLWLPLATPILAGGGHLVAATGQENLLWRDFVPPNLRLRKRPRNSECIESHCEKEYAF